MIESLQDLSKTQQCMLLTLPRSTYYYTPQALNDEALGHLRQTLIAPAALSMAISAGSKFFRIQPALYGADTAIDNASTMNIRALKEAGVKNAIDYDLVLNKVAEYLVND